MDNLNVNEFINDLEYVEPKFCSKCFTTLKDFVDTGFLGCENCYKVFKNEIESFVKSCQISTKHVGKIYATNLSNEQKIRELSLELNLAIKEQRFEDCAVIKRKIDALKEQ